MRPRFYAPDLSASADRVALPPDEAEHLVRVLRLGAGDEVSVIDGRGGAWRAEVVHADRTSATVRPLARELAAPESGVPLTLVAAVLKSDKMDDVVRDAVMLGVAAIQPVVSERTEISLASLAKAKRGERWRRIAVASTKQCGRAVLAAVLDPVSFEDYLAQPLLGIRLMCIEPASSNSDARAPSAIPRPMAAHLLVGPEGGWSQDEVTMGLRAGAMPVSLSGRTLRADAVPIVALSALLTTWGEL